MKKLSDRLGVSLSLIFVVSFLGECVPTRFCVTITKEFKVAKNKAGRLIMTESAAFSSAAQKDCFSALGVEEYKLVETLDDETCPLCGALDGKVFKMSEYQVGVTAPPFHPWCRGCTAPYFADMEDWKKIRSTKDEDGKTYVIPGDITYSEWAKLVASNENAKELFTNMLSRDIINNSVDKATAFSELIKKQRGLKKDFRTEIETAFSNGSEDAKSAFLKYAQPSSLGDAASKNGAYFSPDTRKVYFNMADTMTDPRGPAVTYFHEFGHLVDYKSCPGGKKAYTSIKSKSFGAALRADFDSVVQSIMKANSTDRTGAYRILSGCLTGPQMNQISDLYGGLSANAARGTYGHRASYWGSGAVEQEAFAHMFEAQFDPARHTLMEQYFPTALAEFEKILGGLK